MDSNLIAISARCIERIIAVLLGGLAIYYGFRLFLVVPVQTLSDGKIQMPGLSVVLAKAGPGLFFAAFGAIVVVTSLMRPIQVGDGSSPIYAGATEAPLPITKASGTEQQTQHPGTEQDLAHVRLTVQTINCMQRLSTEGPKALSARDAELAVRDAKLALLACVWDVGAWGDFESFKQWTNGATASTTSPAKAIFEAERPDCPR